MAGYSVVRYYTVAMPEVVPQAFSLGLPPVSAGSLGRRGSQGVHIAVPDTAVSLQLPCAPGVVFPSL